MHSLLAQELHLLIPIIHFYGLSPHIKKEIRDIRGIDKCEV
jgi:hypothetical protein